MSELSITQKEAMDLLMYAYNNTGFNFFNKIELKKATNITEGEIIELKDLGYIEIYRGLNTEVISVI